MMLEGFDDDNRYETMNEQERERVVFNFAGNEVFNYQHMRAFRQSLVRRLIIISVVCLLFKTRRLNCSAREREREEG